MHTGAARHKIVQCNSACGLKAILITGARINGVVGGFTPLELLVSARLIPRDEHDCIRLMDGVPVHHMHKAAAFFFQAGAKPGFFHATRLQDESHCVLTAAVAADNIHIALELTAITGSFRGDWTLQRRRPAQEACRTTRECGLIHCCDAGYNPNIGILVHCLGKQVLTQTVEVRAFLKLVDALKELWDPNVKPHKPFAAHISERFEVCAEPLEALTPLLSAFRHRSKQILTKIAALGASLFCPGGHWLRGPNADSEHFLSLAASDALLLLEALARAMKRVRGCLPR